MSNFVSSLLTRVRPVWRTLRFRLAVWNALVVAAISLLVLVGVRQGVRWALLHEIDQLLREDLQEVILAVHDAGSTKFSLLTDELERKAVGHRQHGWFVELHDADQNLIWASSGAPVATLNQRLVGSSVSYTWDGHRVRESRLKSPVHQVGWLRVGANLEFFQRNMAHLDRLIFMATGALVVVAPLCGYWLAGRAARTMGDIIQTAARLRPSHLEERLRLRGTGDELDKLASTINRLLDRIAEYVQQKRDFLANAAHELRTPLAAIRSSVEVALSGDHTSDEYAGTLEDLIDQSAALETLVNQLLLISETETDQWKTRQERVALHEVVRRAVDMFHGVAEAKGVRLRISETENAEVYGSRRHLRQVVNNLIDNAVKYTPPGGTIEASLARDAVRKHVTLTVRDTGIGISQDDLPHVFDRFFRADRSRARNLTPRGTGLGLSICHAVITSHGGEISCDSRLHEGTSVLVILPEAPRAGAERQLEGASTA